MAARFGPHMVSLGQRDGSTETLFSFGDDTFVLRAVETLLPDGKDAVGALAAAGYEGVMLTGDTEAHATKMADALGIDDVCAHVRPEEKLEIIKRLEADGARPLMVGDGLNDALNPKLRPK